MGEEKGNVIEDLRSVSSCLLSTALGPGARGNDFAELTNDIRRQHSLAHGAAVPAGAAFGEESPFPVGAASEELLEQLVPPHPALASLAVPARVLERGWKNALAVGIHSLCPVYPSRGQSLSPSPS